MNKKGISTTTEPGTENYELFYSDSTDKALFQYDYRHYNGELFSCVKPTLEKCREARKSWVLGRGTIEIEYLGFRIRNTWNSDGWVLINDDYNNFDSHLGNYGVESPEAAKRSALVYFLMAFKRTNTIIHHMALYGCGLHLEYSIFEELCEQQDVEIPKEITPSTDTNRSICFNNEVFTNTKNRK